MEIFGYIALYLIPVLGYVFIVILLRAIKKIVHNKPYREELFWSGILFAIIIGTNLGILLYHVS